MEPCESHSRSAASVPLETEWICFRPSTIHGLGGFARTRIPSETRLIEYVGQKISKAESRRRCELNNEYVFALDEENDLDGDVESNPARFLNHSCAPNCEARLQEGRIWIVSLRDIMENEEITFNYGYDLEDFREHPCHCGAWGCLGYIVAEEFFGQIRRRNDA